VFEPPRISGVLPRKRRKIGATCLNIM